MAADGSVLLKFDCDVSDAEKEISKLRKRALSLEDSLNSNKYKRNALAESIKTAREELKELDNRTSVMRGFQISLDDVERANELRAEISDMEKEAKKYDVAIRDGNADLEATENRYNEISAAAERLREKQETGGSGDEAAQLSGIERARALAQEGLTSLKQGFIGLTQLAGSGIFKAFKGIGSAIKKAFTGGVHAVRSFGKGLLNAVGHLNVFGKLSEGLGSKLHRLGGMFRRVFVFSVITKGLRAIRSAFSTMLTQNNALSTSLARLKGVLLTAFQPIYDVIVPALTTLINVLTSALAVVAQFMANLFGRTAKQAQAGAKALNAEAGAINGTGEAAEEAAGSLAGFDEINTITTENAGGGGGGGGEAATAPLFDYEFEDQPPFDSWGEAFNAFLDNILAGIPKLREAFSGFAEWLNGLSFNLLEMFKFPNVKEKVVQIGQELANALNDLVLSINWGQLGQALGAGLNLALLLLVDFIYTFDWLNLGGKLSEAFNGLVHEIDWESFGELLWAGFKIGLETLAGFILNLDMSKETGLPKAASDIAIGFFDSITETIAKIDWWGLGKQVSAFISNINWNGVADALFQAVGAALSGLSAFIGGVISDAFTGIVGYFREKTEECGGNVVLGILKGILDGIYGIGKWIAEHVFTPIITGFCKAFGIHSPSTVMEEQGGYIMDGLLGGIQDKLRPILDFFNGDLFDGIKKALNGVLKFVTGVFTADWGTAWEGVKDIFKGVWNGMVSLLEGAVNLIVDGINGLISKLNTVKFDVPDWVPVIGGSSFGFNISKINRLSIPRLAQGAVIPPNREFMAVLGDQRSGNNIEAPESLIRQIMRDELGSMQITVNSKCEFTGTLSQLARVLQPYITAETSRLGPQIISGGA